MSFFVAPPAEGFFDRGNAELAFEPFFSAVMPNMFSAMTADSEAPWIGFLAL